MEKIKFIKDGSISSPSGFKTTGIKAGIKANGKPDIGLIFSEKPATATGVFTTNAFAAAPVLLSQKQLSGGKNFQAIIINSGNANACTGSLGYKNAEKMTELTAENLEINKNSVLIASTGIIGKQLPMKNVSEGIRNIIKRLPENNGIKTSEAIMTTDTYPKYAAVKFKIGEKAITIGGIAKGSGMIAPKMSLPPHATLLVFLTTDACIEQNVLSKLFSKAINNSFNRINIDGDMSTNDSAFIMANGESKSELISSANSNNGKLFFKALNKLMTFLAKEIVKDGEGVTKFVTLKVLNAKNKQDAKKCATSIATSLLCKTAWFGNDPNWGRIIAAIGYSRAKFQPDKVDVFIDEYPIVLNGEKKLWPKDRIKKIVKKTKFTIKVDLKEGKASYQIWTNDISYKYIEINAEYHT